MLKKLICVCLLVACMVSCVQAEGVMVVAEMIIGEAKEENSFQSFHDWSEGAAKTNDQIVDYPGKNFII